MRIVTSDELAKMPNGTIFSYLDGYNIEGFEIITGSYEWNNKQGFNGTLPLDPSFNWDEDNVERITNWSTIDNADCDLVEDGKYVIYNKNEIKEIIQWLSWAIGECDAPNMENYFYKDKILNELDDMEELHKLTNGRGLWWG